MAISAGLPALPVTSGLVLYLRADLGITLNGSKVSAWGDQSGAGNSVTQASSANQPTYSATGGPKTSLPAVTFVQASSTLLMGSTTPTTGTDETIFVVAKSSGAAGAQFLFHNGNGAGIAAAINTTAGKRDLFVVGVGDAVDGNNTTSWEAWSITTSNTGPLQTLRVNGVAQTLTPNSMAQITPGTGGCAVGAGAGGGDYFDGPIWLVLEYNRVLSGAEIAQVEAWISSITGIF